MTTVAVLGSTGSIGTQTLEVIAASDGAYEVIALGASRSIDLLAEQAKAVRPRVVAIVAPVGDLCESMIKRDLGLKDMGSILPEHGGLLDRFDALLFVLPAGYYVVRALHIAGI